jgi:NitT/TauT family transport system substrate-binding protein
MKTITRTVLLGIMISLGGVTAQAQTTVKLGLGSKPLIDNLPFFIADAKGFYKKHGLAVETSHFRSAENVRALSAGSSNIISASTTTVTIAAAKGESVKILSNLSAPIYGVLWIVKTDSPLTSVSQLSGKKVGISLPGTLTHTILNAAIRKEGLKNVEIVPLPGLGESWQAVKNGRVDVSWYAAPAVYSITSQGEARILFDASEYIQDYSQNVVVSTEDYVKKNPQTVKAFLAAVKEAIAYIETDRADALAIGAKEMDVTVPVLEQAVKKLPKDFFRIGKVTPSNLAASIAIAKETGAFKDDPTEASLTDYSLLPN